jgi:hypothetical protein
MSTLLLIRFHLEYVLPIRACFVINFDAWILLFQEFSAFFCAKAHRLDSDFRRIRARNTSRSLIIHLPVYVEVITQMKCVSCIFFLRSREMISVFTININLNYF